MTDRRAPARIVDARSSTGATRPDGETERPIAKRRPRKLEPADSRLFVSALARGLDVLGAFRVGDGPLGNQELSRRSGLPKPTVSRMTHTLTQLGYLSFDPRLETYELGGRSLSLGYAAISNVDIRRVARPLMQEMAERGNVNVALCMRDKLMILAVESCEGRSLIGLKLSPGARMPLATTAGGKAYLATIGADERHQVLEDLRRLHGKDWPAMRRAIDKSARDMAENGFCLSVGEWQTDINGAGAAVVLPNGSGVYALAIGGPAYLISRDQLVEVYGPMLAGAARRVEAQLGAEGGDPAGRG